MKGPRDLIEEALAKGQTALDEHNSKRFLSCFGIPVSQEAVAKDADSAVTEAMKIGFPVVLKASGTRLFHKTEVEGVVLNLRSKEEVTGESQRLLRIEGCEALLVQEMVKGHRELVCGLTRNPQFGPCVMFGLGGILTELIKDVAFRIAPLSSWDAREMMNEIQCRKVLDPFRGEPGVDLDVLSHTLVALGEIGVQYEDVLEIDINPLKIRSDGKPVAVDALVALRVGGTNNS